MGCNTALNISTTAEPKDISLDVGGVVYRVNKALLLKHPGSLLASIMDSPSFREDESIVIQRDGQIFKYILMYLNDEANALRTFVELKTTARRRLKEEASYFRFSILEDCLTKLSLDEADLGTVQEFNHDAIAVSFDYKMGHTLCYTSISGLSLQKLKLSQNFQHVQLCGKTSFDNCNLSGVTFSDVSFQDPPSFKDCLLTGTTFRNVTGLVSNKVHFTPFQVSVANFEPPLLKALKANHCIY